MCQPKLYRRADRKEWLVGYYFINIIGTLSFKRRYTVDSKKLSFQLQIANTTE